MEREWFYVNARETVGPVGWATLRDFLVRDPKWKKVLVWSEGMEDWLEAADVPEFEELKRRAPPKPPLKATNPWRARFYAIVGFILMVIAASFGGLIGKGAVQTVLPYVGTQYDPFSAENARTLEAQAKASFPKQVDQLTTLVDAKFSGRSWTYYLNVDTTMARFSKLDLDDIKREGAAKVCRDETTLKLYKRGLVMSYVFKNKSGAVMGTYDIGVTDCPST